MISSPEVQVVDEPLPGGGCYPGNKYPISSLYVQLVDGPRGGVLISILGGAAMDIDEFMEAIQHMVCYPGRSDRCPDCRRFPAAWQIENGVWYADLTGVYKYIGGPTRTATIRVSRGVLQSVYLNEVQLQKHELQDLEKLRDRIEEHLNKEYPRYGYR